MPENLDNNENNSANDAVSNDQERTDETNKSQTDFTGQGISEFDAVMEKVRKRMEEDLQKEEDAKLPDPMHSEQFAKSEAARKQEQYQRKKQRFEQANTHIQTLRNLNAERNMTVEAKREQARQQAKEEIERVARKQMEKDMTVQQKMLVDVAGNRALDVLYSASEKLAEQAERGGSTAYMIIFFTYFIAFTKDLLDVVIDLAMPEWSFIITSIIGTICSVFLVFFWLSVSGGNWHGGMVTNQIVRYLLGGIIDSIPIFGIVPTYIVLNLWSHIDFLKSKREAAEKREEVDQQISDVKTEMRSNGSTSV